MKWKSALVTALSGKVGGMVASRNKGGQYFRAWANPINPNTPQQQTTRASLGMLSQAWAGLTDLQREFWRVYAETVPIPDTFGDDVFLSAFNQFIRSNTPRVNVGLPIQTDGPAELNLGEVGPVALLTASAGSQNTTFAFDTTDDWVDEDDSAMLVYYSAPQSPTINFFKGPYRFAGAILGDATTPPTTPATIAVPTAIQLGQKLFYRCNVTREDGRLSQTFRGELIVGA